MNFSKEQIDEIKKYYLAWRHTQIQFPLSETLLFLDWLENTDHEALKILMSKILI